MLTRKYLTPRVLLCYSSPCISHPTLADLPFHAAPSISLLICPYLLSSILFLFSHLQNALPATPLFSIQSILMGGGGGGQPPSAFRSKLYRNCGAQIPTWSGRSDNFQIYLFCIHTLAHSFVSTKNSTRFFSSNSALFAKNTRGYGGGVLVPSRVPLFAGRGYDDPTFKRFSGF
jgi:hypothetical protein